MELTGIHPSTARLAVELQLADINSILDGLNPGDEFAAFDAMRRGFEDALARLQDQCLALAILRTDHNDRVAFEHLVYQERQAERDHEIAREMEGFQNNGSVRPPDYAQHRPDSQMSWVDLDPRDLSASLAAEALHIDVTTIDDSDLIGAIALEDLTPVYELADEDAACAAESSKRAWKGKRRATEESEHVTHVLCSAFMEQCPRFDVLELDCKREGDVHCHALCRHCLVDLFRASLTDTTLFPPRCCGVRIPAQWCRGLCPSRLIEQYEEKQFELSVPNPVYCSNRSCTKFIKPETITADVAICQSCGSETCAVCKNTAHQGVCPEDPYVQKLISEASQRKWQRCPKCRTMVELATGCFHITCRCGKDFCYICAKTWKTCACPQWEENYLIAGTPGTATPRHHIAMPEEVEVKEADPVLEVLNDLQKRVATVAGGFVIEEPGSPSSMAAEIPMLPVRIVGSVFTDQMTS